MACQSLIEKGGGKFCSRTCYHFMPLSAPLEERLSTRVEITDTCWNWTGSVNNYGYGFWRGKRGTKMVLVHRFSWEKSNGDIPEGLCVLHQCDNRRCVNPDHLFLGTRRDNMLDMIAKGRHWRNNSVVRSAYISNQENARHAPVRPNDRNAIKTHCPRGHPYDEANTYHHMGRRHCKACSRLRYKAWWEDKYATAWKDDEHILRPA